MVLVGHCTTSPLSVRPQIVFLANLQQIFLKIMKKMYLRAQKNGEHWKKTKSVKMFVSAINFNLCGNFADSVEVMLSSSLFASLESYHCKFYLFFFKNFQVSSCKTLGDQFNTDSP